MAGANSPPRFSPRAIPAEGDRAYAAYSRLAPDPPDSTTPWSRSPTIGWTPPPSSCGEHLEQAPHDVVACVCSRMPPTAGGMNAEAERGCASASSSLRAMPRHAPTCAPPARQQRSAEVLPLSNDCSRKTPRNAEYLATQGTVALPLLGRTDEGIALLQEDHRTSNPTRKACGCCTDICCGKSASRPQAIEAYRRALELRPQCGARLLEPGESEDLSLRCGGSCGHAGAAGAARRARGGACPSGVRTGQGARGSGRSTRAPSSITRAATRCSVATLVDHPDAATEVAGTLNEALHRGVLRRARRLGQRAARPDLHRWAAALGLDAARADPGESLAGRGHARATGGDRHRARAEPRAERR